jgi:hypothetical protein
MKLVLLIGIIKLGLTVIRCCSRLYGLTFEGFLNSISQIETLKFEMLIKALLSR